MLGDIGIAEVSVFLILAWVSAAAVIATVVLYRLHFRKAFFQRSGLAFFASLRRKQTQYRIRRFRTILRDHVADSCAHNQPFAGRMHARGFSALMCPGIGSRRLAWTAGIGSQDQAQAFRLCSISPKNAVESLSGDRHLIDFPNVLGRPILKQTGLVQYSWPSPNRPHESGPSTLRLARRAGHLWNAAARPGCRDRAPFEPSHSTLLHCAAGNHTSLNSSASSCTRVGACALSRVVTEGQRPKVIPFERLFKERGLPANIRSDNGVPLDSSFTVAKDFKPKHPARTDKK